MRPAWSRFPLAAAVAAAIALAPAPARADIADLLDQPAREIECAKWAAGQPTQIAKLRGRVVVLHVSDPDRITAQAAFPTLKKLADAWKDAPVTVVEVLVTPMESAATVYASKQLPGWAVGWDPKGATSVRYPGTSIPRTYLIGPDGRVVWHAHVQALTRDLVRSQVDRVQFFAPGPEVKKAKGVAKAAAEQRFGAALAEAAKVEADKHATDADRALCAAVRSDVETTWKLQKKLLDALVTEIDWGLAWRRAERMQALFRGTAHEADANAEVRKLEENPSVAYVRPAQDQYDKLLEEAVKARTGKDLASLIEKVRLFADQYENTRPAEKAADLLKSLEKRLSEAEGG